MTMLSIGSAAHAADVGVETIRFYQRQKLIETPEKQEHGPRKYDEDTVARIRFIKHAQTLGFTLKEVASLLSLSSEQCDDVKKKAQEKAAEVEQKISDLHRMQDALAKVIERCDESSSSSSSKCPFLAALSPVASASQSTSSSVSIEP